MSWSIHMEENVGRCVHCGRPGEAHGGQSTTYGSMALPAGKTCADCVWLKRCEALGVVAMKAEPRDTCDWYPIRFFPVKL